MGATTTTTLTLPGGTGEVVGFFGDLFGVTHLPNGPATGGVVVCSPLYSEFLKNNRREVLLGRRLAERGFAVQRFHYRGTGNSAGDASALSLETMSEDAALAAARLREVAGVESLDVVSTRLAALVAASITGHGSRIIMWEPVDDGKKYFRELTRAVLILGVKHKDGRTAADIENDFATLGYLDIAGFSVAAGLRDSATSARLEIPAGDGSVLIAQLGRSAETRKDIAAIASRAETGGRQVTIRALELEEAWWFHQDVNLLRPGEGAVLDDALVELTAEWLGGPR